MCNSISKVDVQLNLSVATQRLLAAAISVDIEDWRQAREHASEAEEHCAKVIEALEKRLDSGAERAG